jgi:hypothetical protein
VRRGGNPVGRIARVPVPADRRRAGHEERNIQTRLDEQKRDKEILATAQAATAASRERFFQFMMGRTTAEDGQVRALAAEAAARRRPDAEPGSPERPVLFVDGQEIRRAQPQRQPDGRDRQLARARAVDRDGFMAEQVRRFNARRDAAQSAARQAEIAELERYLGYR